MPTPPDGLPSGADDEDFDRRFREIARGEGGSAGRAVFKEPSAAERARQAAAQQRRESRKARKLRAPAAGGGSVPTEQAGVRGGRPGGASRGVPRQGRQSAGTTVITILVLACLAGGVLALNWLSHRHSAGHSGPAPAASVRASSVPRSRPSPSVTPVATVAEPFLGTPAAAYADRAAGIVRPAAHRTGTFSAGQVRAAYTTTRNLLIAANLDRQTLDGGSPAAFARLLTPQQRRVFRRGLAKTGLTGHGFQRSTRSWVASFAPGSSRFAGTVIKVHGRMTARTAKVSGERVLQVHADYLFVYPVTSPDNAASLTRIVVRDAVNVDFARWDDPAGSLEPWWDSIGGGAAGSLCGVSDGFIHPAFPGGAPQKVTPSGSPVDPYDQSIPPDTQAGCRRSTRT